MTNSTRRRRFCLDCPTDITSRRADAKRCEPCSLKRRRTITVAWHADRRPRRCIGCQDTIPASKPPNTKRCTSCAEAFILERHRLQRSQHHHIVGRLNPKPTAPPLADHDMTPARVIEVEGEQYDVAWSGGAGLSSVGARGSTLVDSRGAVRRNGSIVMGGL